MKAPVRDSVEMKLSLRCFVRREGSLWLSVCPALDVRSQGAGRSEAIDSLQEAIQLWFESCIERGVLSQALQELGFRPSSVAPPEGTDSVALDIRREDESVLGKIFPMTISIPAYQSALFGSGQSHATR